MSTKFLELAFLPFLFALCCEGRVFRSSSNEDIGHSIESVEYNSKLFRTVDQPGVKHRHIRGAGEQNEPNFVHHEFSDTSHNQAMLHWSGKSGSHVMFMLTRQTGRVSVTSSTLYRSENYGANYTILAMPDADALITYFVVSPLDPNILLFIDTTNRTIYKTDNEGNEVTKCGGKLPFVPERIAFSPYHMNHLLVYSYTNLSVHVSSDMCVTWDFISDNVNSRVMWGELSIDPPGTIHMEVQDLTSNGYRYYKFSPPYSNPPQDMFGVIDMDSLHVSNNYIFVQKSTQFASLLYVSYARGEFKRAYFPLDQNPLDFSIVDADESQVFVAANHQAGRVNLYLSDITGQFYTLSLENVKSISFASSFSADVYEVKGLQGVYIANQQTAAGTITRMTFDQGGNWTTVSRPLTQDNKEYKCEHKTEDCNLHLHLFTSDWDLNIPQPTSEKNAPGIIMAQGTVGSKLDTESSLFVSRDGGMVWRFAHKGDFYHSILDQGGAIVAVNITERNKMSRSILFSVNEGLSWESYEFTNLPLQVDGLVNEPGITTLMVSIYGHTEKSGWIVYRADFNPVLSKACTDASYEQWSPADYKGHNCLLGQRIVYSRQKSDAACKNGEGYWHSVSTTNCVCVEEDFECDYGYGRKDDECKPLIWFDPSQPVVRCIEGDNYMQTSGYRKVASDNCTGGSLPAKYVPVATTCPTVAPGGLRISVVGENIVALNDNVTFTLIQDEGSNKSTKYSWEFGDGQKATELTYSESKLQIHIFTKQGLKTVKVTAKNSRGQTTASLQVLVEVNIRVIRVLEPHAAQVGFPVQFWAMTGYTELSYGYFDDSRTHYVWDFGDHEDIGDKPVLTWEERTQHTYRVARNYTCIVSASNAISTKFTTFQTAVYGTLVTVQLTFSDETYAVAQLSLVWFNQFALNVKQAVMELLNINSHTRLEVVSFRHQGTGAPMVDVSFLPEHQAHVYDPSLQPWATKLAEVVNKNQLKIELDENTYGKDELVFAVKAVVLKPNEATDKGKDHTALYVCVPIAIVVTLMVVALVLFYYKRKSQVLGTRYRLLRSRSQQPDDMGNSLLDDDDNTLNDDDDDALIDPSNPPDTQNRLAIDGDDPLGVVFSGPDV